ncbi:Hypothetical protein, putative, partial [Bodo saltans]
MLVRIVAVVALLTDLSQALPNVRYVRLEQSSDPFLVINEVTVYPCGSDVNVALNKPATGSGFGTTGSCGGTQSDRTASVAVDGATSCSADRTNTFCASVSPLFWQVDLGREYDVCTVAILLSTTSTGASYLRLQDGAGTQLTSVSLLGTYSTLTTCGATSCSISTKSCTACTAALCNNHVTSFSDNYPACDCTCNSAYTGAFCDQLLCTNAANCNGHATSVSGYGSSCSCTCSPEWTGTSCATSNVCTNVTNCNSRATAVSGNMPSCTCTCQAEWTGASCETPNVCTTAADCSGHATGVTGNRPSCTCACTLGWVGKKKKNTTGTRVMTGSYPGCVCECILGYGGAVCARLLTESKSSMPSESTTISESLTKSLTSTLSATSSPTLSLAKPTLSCTTTVSSTVTSSMTNTNTTSVTHSATHSLSLSPTTTHVANSSSWTASPTHTRSPTRTANSTGSSTLSPILTSTATKAATATQSPTIGNTTFSLSPATVSATTLFSATQDVLFLIDGVEFVPSYLLPDEQRQCVDLRVYGNVTNATATHLASYLARNVSVSINALNATA